MSVWVTIPMSLPPSITGSFFTRASAISFAAFSSFSSGVIVMSFLDISAPTLVLLGSRPLPTALRTSPSVTIPTGLSSTTTMEPILDFVIALAAPLSVFSGPIVFTRLVMMSLTKIKQPSASPRAPPPDNHQDHGDHDRRRGRCEPSVQCRGGYTRAYARAGGYHGRCQLGRNEGGSLEVGARRVLEDFDHRYVAPS